MERYKVIDLKEDSIVFSTLDEMEQAYQQLADGKDIIIYMEKESERAGEILSGKIFARIMDGEFKLFSKEKF